MFLTFNPKPMLEWDRFGKKLEEATMIARTKYKKKCRNVKILLLSTLAPSSRHFTLNFRHARLLPSVQITNTCGFGMATTVTAITAYFRCKINKKVDIIQR